ncbi:MAG: hypothetical protein AAF843_15915 [Bacteroidota bacterium]
MKYILKVSLVACLFLWPIVNQAQDLPFGHSAKKAYGYLWNLEPPSQLEKIPNNKIEIYIYSLHLALHTILAEDQRRLSEYESRYKILESGKDETPDDPLSVFLEAEMLLHYAFVQLKYQNELSAAWAIRKSYKLAKDGSSNYPDYKPLIKTIAIHNVIMGSVPKKYDWLMSLLGLEGNVNHGLSQLRDFSRTKSPLRYESEALLALLSVYLKNDDSYQNSLPLPNTKLTALVKVLIYLKTSNNLSALTELRALASYEVNYPILSYLTAEARLRAEEYAKSRAAYLKFIGNSNSQSNIRDAYFKIALTYHITRKSDSARYFLNLAGKSGKAVSEADKYAERIMKKERLPDPRIWRIRFLTDGGYYYRAQKLVSTISSETFQNSSDQLEFQYRSARLYHKQKKPREAQQLYQSVIVNSSKKGNYFAPNSCLQLGYIYKNNQEWKKAAYYFEKVKEYSGYEYKSSIERKAKNALLNLPKTP